MRRCLVWEIDTIVNYIIVNKEKINEKNILNLQFSRNYKSPADIADDYSLFTLWTSVHKTLFDVWTFRNVLKFTLHQWLMHCQFTSALSPFCLQLPALSNGVLCDCVGFVSAQAIRHSDPITNTNKDNCEQSLTLTLDMLTLTRFRFD